MKDATYSAVEIPDVAVWKRCRIWLSMLVFFGFIFLYAQRVGMSVAIVCMVNQTAVRELREAEISVSLENATLENGQGYTLLNTPMNSSTGQEKGNVKDDEGECDMTPSSDKSFDGPFVWPKQLQGHILGSFFYGYLVSQVPAGLMAQRFNAKWVFAAFYTLSAVGTVLTPIAANMHFGVLIAVRAIVGLGSGGIFPATHCILGQWAPPLERSLLTGIAYAGFSLGNVVALPVSGFLCQDGFSQGWDSIFYVFGFLSAAWLVIFVFLVGETPATCRIMSKVEEEYVKNSLAGQLSKSAEKKTPKTPWLSMLKSPAVWAIIAANVTSDWGIYTMLTNIPTYMYEVLHFDMASNGMFSALPFLGMWIMMTIAPPIADKVQAANIMSTATSRKMFNSIAEFGACIFLIALGFVTCTQTGLAVALLTLGATVHGATYSAWLVNPMDIAPQFAGTIFGISNCLGAMTGFIAPPVAAWLTPNQTREEWQIVFFVAAGIYAFGGIVYIIFARGELQSWAIQDDLRMDYPLDGEPTLLSLKESDESKRTEAV